MYKERDRANVIYQTVFNRWPILVMANRQGNLGRSHSAG